MGFAYNPKGGWTSQHQMSINGKFDEITRKDLLSLAERNNIKEAPEIIDALGLVASRWPEIASNVGVPKSIIDNIHPQFQIL